MINNKKMQRVGSQKEDKNKNFFENNSKYLRDSSIEVEDCSTEFGGGMAINGPRLNEINNHMIQRPSFLSSMDYTQFMNGKDNPNFSPQEDKNIN